MSRNWELVLLAIGLLVAAIAAVGVSSPGYMDAEYYFVTGLEISQGDGFVEPFIWNYLNEPSGLPHPSHGYWMPLTSLLVAIPTLFSSQSSFRLAQSPFILLFALLPWLTARFSFDLHGDERAAFQSGLLAAVPGFFLPFFVTTDMFILYAWVGTLFFWTCHRGLRGGSERIWILAGGWIGLAHLARADGLLFLIPFLYILSRQRETIWRRLLFGTAGYLLVMGPWFLRNLGAFGTMLPVGTQSALWLRSYEDLFRYPASDLQLDYLLQAGWRAILQVRLSALWTNLQRVIAENGLVFLLPFMLVGLRSQWKTVVFRSAALYWGALLLVMSFVFPFAGAQGGTFHSSAALMPALWALVPFGLREVIGWVGVRRGWDIPQSIRNFSAIFITLAAAFTFTLLIQRTSSLAGSGSDWDAGAITYQNLGERLMTFDPHPGVVAVNNPPGFYAATGIQAVVVPSGGVGALERVVHDFQVSYVILDQNHPEELRSIYSQENLVPWLRLVEQIESGSTVPILIFRTSLGRGGE